MNGHSIVSDNHSINCGSYLFADTRSHLSVDEAVINSYSIDLDCINFALEASFNLDISQETPRSFTNQP
jgi:hypothetical protein